MKEKQAGRYFRRAGRGGYCCLFKDGIRIFMYQAILVANSPLDPNPYWGPLFGPRPHSEERSQP